jgi:hypothetical protein
MIGWLLTATQDGATRLQAIVMVMALIGVIYMWVGMIKEGLEVEQNEQSKN